MTLEAKELVLLYAEVDDVVMVALATIDADVLSEDGVPEALLSVVFDEKLVNEAEPVAVKEEINWEVDRMEAEKLKESELESKEPVDVTFVVVDSDDTFCMELRLSGVDDGMPSALADELANELGVVTAEEVEVEVAGRGVRLVKDVKLTAAEELVFDVADTEVPFVNGADVSKALLLVLANAAGDVVFAADVVASEVIRLLVFDATDVEVLLENKADVSDEELLVLTDAEDDVEFAGEELTPELAFDVSDTEVLFANGVELPEDELLVLADAAGDVAFTSEELTSEVICDVVVVNEVKFVKLAVLVTTSEDSEVGKVDELMFAGPESKELVAALVATNDELADEEKVAVSLTDVVVLGARLETGVLASVDEVVFTAVENELEDVDEVRFAGPESKELDPGVVARDDELVDDERVAVSLTDAEVVIARLLVVVLDPVMASDELEVTIAAEVACASDVLGTVELDVELGQATNITSVICYAWLTKSALTRGWQELKSSRLAILRIYAIEHDVYDIVDLAEKRLTTNENGVSPMEDTIFQTESRIDVALRLQWRECDMLFLGIRETYVVIAAAVVVLLVVMAGEGWIVEVDAAEDCAELEALLPLDEDATVEVVAELNSLTLVGKATSDELAEETTAAPLLEELPEEELVGALAADDTELLVLANMGLSVLANELDTDVAVVMTLLVDTELLVLANMGFSVLTNELDADVVVVVTLLVETSVLLATGFVELD
ncbi:uncharacterized protein AB675_829 [Cyphellophora attinorum]|uniref:Uncharacterized protein n=1 Tax=Cyphellophora attinorum TaxID=1664694 RepID=A0A0N1HBD3_9EURO|nr:uncharacterized protein AB675_829 [Phialophora attinorum]KPI45855.1 hypothetical protein AB675_829 [Phialophora attinorum]